jgi:D-glycero-D-manno-heptose 1,7-bisphosphate phosphatase
VSAPAVFLDRDGTLMEEVNYCADPALVRVFPGVSAALRRLKEAGFLLFVITNQAGIARGLISHAQYRAVEREFLRQLGDGLMEATYFCADAPDAGSARRKPEPGMVLEAAADFDLDLTRSWFIGDKTSDIECGRRAGTRTILVRTGYGAGERCKADFTARDVAEAAEIVLTAS